MPMNTVQNPLMSITIQDARVLAVIERMQAARRRPASGGPKDNPVDSYDPHDFAEYGFSIHPEQGDLIYLLCRGMRATRVAEFATSIGMSTLYFAAAMRDNGGGKVIGSELVPAKAATARRNLNEAGLIEYCRDSRGGCAADAAGSRRAGRFRADRWLAGQRGSIAGA